VSETSGDRKQLGALSFMLLQPLVFLKPPLRKQPVPSRNVNKPQRRHSSRNHSKATHCSRSSPRNSSAAALACQTQHPKLLQ
jgi:hypothetical protein